MSDNIKANSPATALPIRGGSDYWIALNRVSWGAVLAGVVVALVVQLLLNLLGIGIGLATIDPGKGGTPSAGTFSIVAAVWYVVAGVIAAFIGGYFASRLSGKPLKSTGALHALTSWAVTTLVLFYLLTTAVGGLVGGAFSTLGSAIGGLGNATSEVAKAVAPPDPFDAIKQRIQTATGADDAKSLQANTVQAVKQMLTGSADQVKQARQKAAEALAKSENVPVDQAQKQIGQWLKDYQDAVAQAKQKATQAAQATAKAASRAALFGFVALVLGGLAALLGGMSGAVSPIAADAAARRES